MTTLVYTVTAVVALLGIGVAIWSIIYTRKKFYEEYKSRKLNDK